MTAPLPDPLARQAAVTPHAVAFHPVGEVPALTYAALDRLAGGYAALLQREGIATGDRVALLARNRPDFFALLFACLRTGAILVPLNWRMPPAELAGVIADAEPALLIADGEHLATGAALHPRTLPLAPAGGAAPLRPVATDAPWYILYTSGTTGRPKGVVQTAGTALANRANAVAATGLSAADRVLAAMPLFHTAGINLYALPALLSGASVHLLPEFDATAMAALIAADAATICFAVPQAWEAVIARPGFVAGTAMRHWGCGGAPLPERLLARAAARGVVLQNGMGMTETGPVALVMDRAAVGQRPRAAGRAQPGVAVRLVADGRDVAPGAVGEIWFSGPAVAPGYWRRPAETATAFRDGWLRSGDLGRMDAGGYVTLVGRMKDMFVSGGENVYPAEVEAVLERHPAVAAAAVVGVSDPRWGEVGHAWLELRAGAACPPDGELARHCRAALAGFKCPVSFAVVAQVPRTASGKVMKQALPAPPVRTHAAA